MYVDSVREQGEKLGLLGSGGEDQPSLLGGLRGRGGPIAGAMNAKKMRKAMGVKEQKPLSQVDQKKELLRLKKEIQEKKRLEKKVAQLENEAQLKQKEYQEKFGEAAKAKQPPNQRQPPQLQQPPKN